MITPFVSARARADLPRRQLFEGLLIASFVFGLVQAGLQFDRSIAVNGVAISVVKLVASPVLAVLIGLLISRLRSRVAAIFFCLSVAASIAFAVDDALTGYAANVPYVVGVGTILIDLCATALIVKWFRTGALSPGA